MATEPYFDLSALDLDAVAIDADAVGRINPQCGDMRQLDHVIWHTDRGKLALGVKHVTDDEFWVPLHIPGRPLMPGVLMIEAAAQLSSIQFQLRSGSGNDKFIGFTRCDETVFRSQVVPGEVLYLLGREVSFKGRRFINEAQGIVGGKLVFETKITGMVL